MDWHSLLGGAVMLIVALALPGVIFWAIVALGGIKLQHHLQLPFTIKCKYLSRLWCRKGCCSERCEFFTLHVHRIT